MDKELSLVKQDVLTWFCHQGCNNFQSDQYQLDELPECGSCGADMSTESDSFDAVHLAIEEGGIALFEQAIAVS